MNKALAASLLLVCSFTTASFQAYAQDKAPAAKPAAKPAPSKAKQELIAKVLELQKPAVQAQARAMAEQPAAIMLQRAATVVQQRLPADKREALLKDLENDARQYLEETGPMTSQRAVALMPTTMGEVLDAKLSEAELKRLITILQDPVLRKFEQSQGDMVRAMQEKLVPDVRPQLEGRLKTLELTMGRKLETAIAATAPASSASAPAAPAAPASKP